jgi:hypothetical protein
MAETLNGISDRQKIDSAATLGLTGTDNSLAYRVNEVERHLHSYQRAYGLAAVPAGTTHRADEITDDPAPFQIDAGNDTWGTAIQVFGSTDTPSGWSKYDPHKISIVSVETANATYFIQMIAGATAAAGITAGAYSSLVFRPQSVQGRPADIPVNVRRQDAGTNLWIRTLARGQNTATMDLYIELHGYEG